MYINIAIFIAATVLGLLILLSVDEKDNERSDVLVKPGLKYEIGGRKYEIPNIDKIGDAYLLKEDFILRMRRLLITANSLFKDKKIDTWLSGGTLLGFIRHHTFIPWDDDLDIHTSEKNKEYMFSNKFKKDLAGYDLEPLYLAGMTEKFSYYKGGVRIRLLGTMNPVMDIFFVRKSQGKIKKIENWDDKYRYFNGKEIWEKNWIYPLKERKIDDILLKIPSDPENVLKSQYGDTFDKEMHCNHIPHTFLYEKLKLLWRNDP